MLEAWKPTTVESYDNQIKTGAGIPESADILQHPTSSPWLLGKASQLCHRDLAHGQGNAAHAAHTSHCNSLPLLPCMTAWPLYPFMSIAYVNSENASSLGSVTCSNESLTFSGHLRCFSVSLPETAQSPTMSFSRARVSTWQGHSPPSAPIHDAPPRRGELLPNKQAPTQRGMPECYGFPIVPKRGPPRCKNNTFKRRHTQAACFRSFSSFSLTASVTMAWMSLELCQECHKQESLFSLY